ncbi:hypothetical protein J6590_025274 [Homalodisca vitripennis]|nr:hypothetical protein J6590_025274 [Homalodisca vitripennis]
MYLFGAVMTIKRLLTHRKTVRNMFPRHKLIEEELKFYGVTSDDKFALTLKISLVVAFFGGSTVDLIVNNSGLMIDFSVYKDFPITHLLNHVAILLAGLPFFSAAWAAYYVFYLGYVMELEVVEALHECIVEQGSAQLETPTIVLPPVEEVVTIHSDQRFPQADSLLLYRTMEKTVSYIKNTRYASTSVFWPLLSWMALSGSVDVPAMFAWPHYNGGIRAHEETSVILTNAILAAITLSSTLVIPVLLHHFLEQRTQCFVVKVSRKISVSSDHQTRKALHSIGKSIKNQFPDSPLKFFEFDCTLLQIITDFSILIGTTFLAER